jgi:hypothetical protein
MRDQELEHSLAQRVFLRRHLVRRMGDEPGAEDNREIYVRLVVSYAVHDWK